MRLKNTPTASVQRGETHLPNECPDYDIKGTFGNVEHPFIAMTSRPTLTRILNWNTNNYISGKYVRKDFKYKISHTHTHTHTIPENTRLQKPQSVSVDQDPNALILKQANKYHTSKFQLGVWFI